MQGKYTCDDLHKCVYSVVVGRWGIYEERPESLSGVEAHDCQF